MLQWNDGSEKEIIPSRAPERFVAEWDSKKSKYFCLRNEHMLDHLNILVACNT